MRCMGSAHCDYYHSSEESITDVSHKRERIQCAQPFNGVKKILMEDIEIEDNKFAPPSQEKVQAAISSLDESRYSCWCKNKSPDAFSYTGQQQIY